MGWWYFLAHTMGKLQPNCMSVDRERKPMWQTCKELGCDPSPDTGGVGGTVLATLQLSEIIH